MTDEDTDNGDDTPTRSGRIGRQSTDISLREYIDLKFESHEDRHRSEGSARKVAEGNVERRLTELNGLRAEVVTDRGTFVRVDALDGKLEAVDAKVNNRADRNLSKIEVLDQRLDTLEKAQQRAEGAVNTWRWIAGFLGMTGVGAFIFALFNSTRIP